jgi:hypothetical protein
MKYCPRTLFGDYPIPGRRPSGYHEAISINGVERPASTAASIPARIDGRGSRPAPWCSGRTARRCRLQTRRREPASSHLLHLRRRRSSAVEKPLGACGRLRFLGSLGPHIEAALTRLREPSLHSSRFAGAVELLLRRRWRRWDEASTARRHGHHPRPKPHQTPAQFGSSTLLVDCRRFFRLYSPHASGP